MKQLSLFYKTKKRKLQIRMTKNQKQVILNTFCLEPNAICSLSDLRHCQIETLPNLYRMSPAPSCADDRRASYNSALVSHCYRRRTRRSSCRRYIEPNHQATDVADRTPAHHRASSNSQQQSTQTKLSSFVCLCLCDRGID